MKKEINIFLLINIIYCNLTTFIIEEGKINFIYCSESKL